jgi:hypothetical protein
MWIVSLIGVGAISSSVQAQRGRPGFNFLTTEPTVVFGNDVGFRVERTQDGIPVGKVVIRIDGRWVDTIPPNR